MANYNLPPGRKVFSNAGRPAIVLDEATIAWYDSFDKSWNISETMMRIGNPNPTDKEWAQRLKEKKESE